MGSLTRCLRLSSLALAAATSIASPARAEDALVGSNELVEKGHVIAIRMDRGHAELLVRRTVHNGGTKPEQAFFQVELPAGAVATGLRTLGKKNNQPFWFQADLTEAQAAAKKYRSLPATPGVASNDPALLAWMRQSQLSLQVFPVAPSGQKIVEYTLKIPTSYKNGRFHIKLPRVGTSALAADAVVLPVHAEDTLFIDGNKADVGTQIKLSKQEGFEIALAQGAQPPLHGALAMVPLAKDRALVHFRFEAGAALSEVPRKASVVVLLDASRSLTQEEVHAAKAAAGAYLSHFSDANVEIITFNRRAREHFGGLVPVSKALLELQKLGIERANGSAIDEALARADARLAKAPFGSARRIVLFTDLKTKNNLSPEVARRSMSKSGALLHIAMLRRGRPSLAREEEHAWDSVARPTGGLLWSAGVSADLHEREAQKKIYEELARPLRIDHLKVSGQGLTEDDVAMHPATLNEGQGLVDFRIMGKQVPWVEVKGELWASPVRKVMKADDGEGRLWSALVFGSELFFELDAKEMMPLATRGQVVSPVTSFLSVGPGERPPVEEVGMGEGFGRSGHGLFGTGHSGGIGRGGGTGSAERTVFLKSALATRWMECGGGVLSIRVELETTLREIVDVRLHRIGPAALDAERCLEEAAWGIDLPLLFADMPWMGASITL